MIAAGTSYCRF